MEMEVNLKAFLLTGEFGLVRFRMTRHQLEDLLGEPDNWGAHRDRYLAAIWKYGSFEFYFPNRKQHDDGLYMIYTDNFQAPLEGNQALTIDPWLLNGQLTLPVAEAALNREQITYTHTDKTQPDAVHLTFPSGVVLHFAEEGQDDTCTPVLQAIIYRDNE